MCELDTELNGSTDPWPLDSSNLCLLDCSLLPTVDSMLYCVLSYSLMDSAPCGSVLWCVLINKPLLLAVFDNKNEFSFLSNLREAVRVQEVVGNSSLL